MSSDRRVSTPSGQASSSSAHPRSNHHTSGVHHMYYAPYPRQQMHFAQNAFAPAQFAAAAPPPGYMCYAVPPGAPLPIGALPMTPEGAERSPAPLLFYGNPPSDDDSSDDDEAQLHSLQKISSKLAKNLSDLQHRIHQLQQKKKTRAAATREQQQQQPNEDSFAQSLNASAMTHASTLTWSGETPGANRSDNSADNVLQFEPTEQHRESAGNESTNTESDHGLYDATLPMKREFVPVVDLSSPPRQQRDLKPQLHLQESGPDSTNTMEQEEEEPEQEEETVANEEPNTPVVAAHEEASTPNDAARNRTAAARSARSRKRPWRFSLDAARQARTQKKKKKKAQEEEDNESENNDNSMMIYSIPSELAGPLLAEIERHPLLWNPKYPMHRNDKERKRVFRSLHQKFPTCPTKDIRNFWTRMRAMFMQRTRSGHPPKTIKGIDVSHMKYLASVLE